MELAYNISHSPKPNWFIGNLRDDVANVGQIGNLSYGLPPDMGSITANPREPPNCLRLRAESVLHWKRR